MFTSGRKQQLSGLRSPPGQVAVCKECAAKVTAVSSLTHYAAPTVSALGMSSLARCQSVAANKREPNFASPWSEWTSEKTPQLQTLKANENNTSCSRLERVCRASANNQSWHMCKAVELKKMWIYFISRWLFQALVVALVKQLHIVHHSITASECCWFLHVSPRWNTVATSHALAFRDITVTELPATHIRAQQMPSVLFDSLGRLLVSTSAMISVARQCDSHCLYRFIVCS